MKVDVLFIHPSNQRRTYQNLSNTHTAIATPVWTCLLAQSTRSNGYAAAIYDVDIDGWDEQVPRELIARFNPELIVMMVYGHTPCASTQTMPAASKIAKDIKSCNSALPIAMGGIHPSALPERTLREEAIDFVICGEGIYTILGLTACLKGKKALDDVPGLYYRKDGDVAATTPAPIASDLDTTFPDYAWDLLPPLSKYRAHTMHCFQDFEHSTTEDGVDVRSPYVTLNTSLGCPYNCHYCCINSIFGKPSIRYWSVEKVMQWMDRLSAQKVRNIRLDDELFVLNPKRVEQLCDALIERKYDMNFWVYGRVDTIAKEPLLKKMKAAGFNWICLGIESASEHVRHNVNKDIRDDIATVVSKIRAQGIHVLGNYMFGLPEDTNDTMETTLKLAIKLNCEFVNFYTVMAFPGSPLYNEAIIHEGHVPSNWNAFSQYSIDTQPLPTHYITAAEVLRFRDEAFMRYFSNPKYLNMMSQMFGTKVRTHLAEMLKIKVERRLISDK